MIIHWKQINMFPLYFILPPFTLFQFELLLLQFIPLFIHPHHMFSPPLRLEPSTLRFWAWRANHYTTPPVQKSELKMNLINGFSSTIDLLENYRIFQYFSLIIFMVLTKLSPCLHEISIIQQEHMWSVTSTNSISKFSKYFILLANYKKFQ